MLEIPPDQLSPAALTNLIEDFVTREGRNHDQDEYSVDQMIQQVRDQLDAGDLAIAFDEDLGSCTILHRRDMA